MKNNNEELDLLDIILDSENRDPITLVDEDGRQISFEQVAVVPYNNNIYCILKPLDHIDGIADDEAIVFSIDITGEQTTIHAETDEEISIKVFEMYYDLLEKAQNDPKQ